MNLNHIARSAISVYGSYDLFHGHTFRQYTAEREEFHNK